MDKNFMNNIYLDYAASTPVDQQVVNAMLPYFTEVFGNPSSIHFFGQQAEKAIEESRQIVADILHARPDEVFFTSCGTESDNLALRGTSFARQKMNGKNRILISPVEHHAVIHTARQLAENHGFKLDFLPVDEYGQVDPAEIEANLNSETALVSVVYANNEIGTINPISAIGAGCRKNGIPFHTDAVQAAAHLSLNVKLDQVDLLAIGAHKFYGPKGVGALFVRRGVPILPIITGGKQEMGLRAGTENIPYIVGLAKAMQLAQTNILDRSAQLSAMRDYLIFEILKRIPRARLTGHPTNRLPNHASFVFENVDGNKLLMLLDVAGFSCSSGSACKVGSPKPSEVLLAIGLSKKWALGSLRVTLGRDNNETHIDKFIHTLPDLVEKVRIL
jgi:cysteine desulfurase